MLNSAIFRGLSYQIHVKYVKTYITMNRYGVRYVWRWNMPPRSDQIKGLGDRSELPKQGMLVESGAVH